MQSINTKTILKIFLEHTVRYKKTFFVTFLCVIVASLVDIFVPVYYKRFFDVLAGGVEVAIEDDTGLMRAIVTILILHLVGWVCWRSSGFLESWWKPRIMADLSQTAHDALHAHSYQFFSDRFAGSLVRMVGRFERAFDDLIEQILWKFLPLTIVIIGYLIVLFMRHPLLAWLLIGWMILFLGLNIAYALWKSKYDAKRAEIDSEATGILADSITNAVTTKLFTGYDHERFLFREVKTRLQKMQTFTWSMSNVMDAVQALLMISIEFVMMFIAIKLWKTGVITIGDFALIQGYLLGMFGKLWDIGRAIRRAYEGLADADEMVKIMETTPSIMDVHQAKKLIVNIGNIEFKNVYFSFNKTRRILRGLNLQIQAGQKVALVGSSGAGKSTITKLLLRFYDLERGRILINDQNIACVTQDSLRENIAVVPQEPLLFHRTVLENIRYGRRDATDEEVVSAAKKARCHEFITDLQNGYQTYVGERGVKLSGGERQRVAIARAILKNAPILILDEATSSLDSESEALIQEALRELMEGKTTIVIAHRLSTIMEMDRILVIDEGKLVDDGTHTQLIKRKDGIYKNLWEIQAGGFIQ